MGNLSEVVVHEADLQDRDGVSMVLALLHNKYPSITRIYADGGYAGEKPKNAISHIQNMKLEIVKHQKKKQKFARAIVSKSVKRFSGKNCGKNKELERSVEPSETKTALGFVEIH